MRASGGKCARLPMLGVLAAGLALRPSDVGAQLSVAQSEEESEAPADASSRDRHDVVDGDTLSSVAERYLGSAEAWPKLWSYNPEITNPHYIYPGYVLRLREGVDLSGQAVLAQALPPPGTPRGSIGLRRTNRATLSPNDRVVRIGDQVYLDREALATAGKIAGSGEDHLMLSPTDTAFLQFADAGHVPAPGREVTVFIRMHKAEVSPKASKRRVYTSHDGGEIVRVLGWLRILERDTERKMARAMVLESIDPIERGVEVADVPHVLPEVPPKKNTQQLEGKIVAATRALGTLGEGQLVFLDVGSKRGVEVGNRFWVIRQGDAWRQSLVTREERTGAERPELHPPADDAFPPEVVAELRAIYVRPESVTAVITESTAEVMPGDRVELRAGY